MSIKFYNNSKEVMRIDSNGNFGIGTCSPYNQMWFEEPEPEPLTEWYKKSVKQTGLTPHKKELNGNSKT